MIHMILREILFTALHLFESCYNKTCTLTSTNNIKMVLIYLYMIIMLFEYFKSSTLVALQF